MQFNYSIAAIVSANIPAAIKSPKIYALLRVFNSPLQSLFQSFLAYRTASIQEKNKTGQTIVLQRALSQYAALNGGGFEPENPNGGGVVIPQIIGNSMIHVEDFENTVVLPATVLIREKLVPNDFIQIGLISEGVGLQCATIVEAEPAFDFQIRIHQSLIFDVTQKTLRSVVDAYKNVGRTYTIITYN